MQQMHTTIRSPLHLAQQLHRELELLSFPRPHYILWLPLDLLSANSLPGLLSYNREIVLSLESDCGRWSPLLSNCAPCGLPGLLPCMAYKEQHDDLPAHSSAP
jgi:hypothetical protein